ncbi:MAG: SpoIID/LytB domain-containing protein [Syntrophomonadaceae bacterium]|nr:SpoIID/LytB domain-containing protein [Syntrophomonadaceae bacterium]
MGPRKKSSLAVFLTLFLSCIFILAGCDQPQQKPGGQTALPAIPGPINKGAGVEPELLVYLDDQKRVQSMPMEQYIQGVVAGEMEPDWPENALAAQAILARTFTLQKIAENNTLENRNAHASTNEKEFQAYDASKINDRIKNAVEKTRGQVLVHNGNYIRAWFHAYSGGKTATAQEGLDFTQEPTPYIQSIDDSSFDQGIPAEVRNWTASFSLDRVRTAVRQVTGKDPGAVTSIEIVKRSESGRAATLRVNNTEVNGNDFRLALDSTALKSTLITDIKIANGKAVFQGKGYGHGVGMSQWGARVMAEQGKKPEEIALNYFRNCQVVKLW